MAKQLQPIHADQLYPLNVLMEFAGLGRAAFSQMRRDGLTVKYICGRAFVLGDDFIEHVMNKGKDSKDG